MKKLMLLLMMAISFIAIYAQAPTCEERMDQFQQAIETTNAKVKTLEQTIATLQTQVEEVTRQNLALKQAIKLTPTIAEYTSPAGINHRLISAVGNSDTGVLVLKFSLMNTTRKDINTKFFHVPVIVTEKGTILNNKMIKDIKFGNSESSYPTLSYDAPIEVTVTYLTDPDFEYAKTIEYEILNDSNSKVMFKNIPIKWE